MSGGRRAAKALPVGFFARHAAEVARDLLGMMIESRVGGARTVARIVETEAYLGRDDPASHAYALRRNRMNEALYGPAGTWYVYLSYGVHWCANLVCREQETGSAVLLRALEPLSGLAVMRRRRGTAVDARLCAGPGCLTQALGISRALDGLPMPGAPVVVREGTPATDVLVTPRIGITRAADWPLRFVLAGSPWVSGRSGREGRKAGSR